MVTPRSWRNAVAVIVAASVGFLSLGCEPAREYTEDEAREIGALGFAGIDLTDALRRIAAESGIPIFIDEFRAASTEPDLGLYMLDMDLPAGRLYDALEVLRDATKAFVFEVKPGVIYVRSVSASGKQAKLDTIELPEVEFKGTLNQLTRFVMGVDQKAWLMMQPRAGQQLFEEAAFDVPKGTSPLEAMLSWARVSGRSLLLQRAGHATKQGEKEAIIASTLSPLGTLSKPRLTPRFRTVRSVAQLLGLATKRTDKPMVVFDRSILQDGRGSMDYSTNHEAPEMTFDEFIAMLKFHGENPDLFVIADIDGVYRVRSLLYVSILDDREVVRSKVRSGTFEGSLAEFARWLNNNLIDDHVRKFAGGEIAASAPRFKVEIPEGSTAEDALLAFARQSGVSVNVVLLALKDPLTSTPLDHPGKWRGAFLTDLSEWAIPWDPRKD